MKVMPITKIIATTAAAWMLAGGALAQAPTGRSRGDFESEPIAASRAATQNPTPGSREAELSRAY
jgi:hypothetical protein